MRFESYRRLLVPVIAVHNLEEWATVPAFGSISPVLSTHSAASLARPPWHVMEVAWVIATLLPSVLVVAAARARRSPVLDILVCWTASIYLVNVFVPHALELVAGGGYAPGVATALFLNLPFCSLMLRQAVREQYLTPRQLSAVGAIALVSIVPVLLGILWVASAITRFLGV